ncbi:hypothetical protein [Neisseria montereyensis]|uniref:DUF2513 domain-containing protein n=1 Tax=Neisseria montereyensis TaxID=2973938 RepID=A0ABT2F9D1_9NEIS|nr:hypothetical protein [Neisseria montereyensis]MCS4532794.1 hypothetical protein [Neisseria montereyensis]
MQINRELQEKILRHLTECFPCFPNEDFYNELIEDYGQKEVVGTILYLQMHGMLECKENTYIHSTIPDVIWSLTKPTEKAFDFLADDGGLSAIIGVVTVKLHNDTIQELLAAKIEEADITKEEKNALKEVVGTVKGAALSTLTENLINSVSAASVVNLLKTIIGS